MKYKRIIAFGGHSLDAELMGGPFMLKYAEMGAKCTFVHVTTGRLENQSASDLEKQKYLELISKENEESAKAMRCDSWSMGYSAQTLPSNSEFISIVKKILIEEKADCVITHHRGTMHPRHYYTYEGVTNAIKELRAEGNDIQLYYGENCEDLIGFIPTLYLTLSDRQVDTWFNALEKYTIFQGKVNNVPYKNYYYSMGKVRAMEANTNEFVKAYMHAGLINNE